MGKLYDARLQIEKIIQEKKLDVHEAKGNISMKAGFLERSTERKYIKGGK